MHESWKVGDEIYLDFRVRYLTSGHYTITKVGRKWLTFSAGGNDHRCDVSTLAVDGGGRGYGTIGQGYRTKDECDQRRLLGVAWDQFTRKIRNTYQMPKGVTVEAINVACTALGISLQEQD